MPSPALARVNLILSFVGLFIASMLSLAHALNIVLPCGVGSGCDLVTQDPRSQILGIPFAYLGVVAYAGLAALAIIRVFAPNVRPTTLHNLGYGLSFLGLLASIALTTFSVKSLHAVCTWCIGSAVTMSLLFASHALGAAKTRPEAKRPGFADGWMLLILLGGMFFGLTISARSLQAEAKEVRVDLSALKELNEEDLLPPGAHVIGPAGAKATVVMFADLTCPVCRQAYLEISDLMKRRYDFRYAFRHLPLRTHELARPAALLSEMVAEKGRFWDFVSACYREGAENVDWLVEKAVKMGVSRDECLRRLADADDPASERLAKDAAVTNRLDLHSTPSVFILIDGYYPEPITYDGIETMLDHNSAEAKDSKPELPTHRGVQ